MLYEVITQDARHGIVVRRVVERDGNHAACADRFAGEPALPPERAFVGSEHFHRAPHGDSLVNLAPFYRQQRLIIDASGNRQGHGDYHAFCPP